MNNEVAKLLAYYMELAKLGEREPVPTTWKPKTSDISKIVGIHNRGSDGIHGVTYDLATKRGKLAGLKHPSYAVSIFGTRTKIVAGKDLKAEDVAGYVKDNSDLLQRDGVCVGTWYDEGKNKTYLDCVVQVKNLRLPVVLGMAKALGIVSRQLAVFDLQAMDEFHLPRNLQSDKAMAIDRSKEAIQILPITKVDTWARLPSRYDIRGIDTPRRRRASKKNRRVTPPTVPTLKGVRG